MADGHRRLIVVVAAAVLLGSIVGACRLESPPAGREIDGQWVDEAYPCPSEGPLTCQHLAQCATKVLWPSGPPAIDSYEVYSPPGRLQDGTIIVRGGWHVIVVFYPIDGGPPRAVQVRETDDC